MVYWDYRGLRRAGLLFRNLSSINSIKLLKLRKLAYVNTSVMAT